MFKSWAQPVVSKPWGVVTSVLFKISKLSGHRVLNHSKAIAWARATGSPTNA